MRGAILLVICVLISRPVGAQDTTWRLVLLPDTRLGEAEVLVDPFAVAEREDLAFDELPHFDFSYRRVGDHLIPLQAVSVDGEHLLWDYLLGKGRLVVEGGVAHLVLPVSLAEKNANCVHNARLVVTLPTLLGAGAFETSARFSLASETCRYFQWDLDVTMQAQVEVSEVPSAFEPAPGAWTAASKDISSLAQILPGLDVAALANSEVIDPASMTVYGLVLDGVNYLGPCRTRGKDYSPCDQLVLPSYSTAKSLFAGLALMRLEKLYPGSSRRHIADYVPACDPERWGDVTFAQALNMVSGSWESPEAFEDEDNPDFVAAFHLSLTHDEKIAFSCHAYPRQSEPGNKWVYHSTDTYVLGAAMASLLREQGGEDADLFGDLLLPLWEPLGLSPIAQFTRRTYDQVGQPFVGFGLYFLPRDIALLAQALGNGYFRDLLDEGMLGASMQGGATPRGYPATNGYYYSNGFFAVDIGTLLDCSEPRWLPFMSGYGGIRVALLGGGDSYYYFSDGNVFDFEKPMRAIHQVRPLC